MERVTDYLLEAWLAGDLDAARRSEVERAIAADPVLAARVEALRADTARLLVAAPPDRFVAAMAGRRRSELRRRWAGGAAVVALAAVGLLVARAAVDDGPVGGARPELPEEIRVKGAALRVFTRVDDHAEPLADGASVPAGTAVQLVVLEGGLQGAVFSVDGRGAVTRHFPADGTASAPLPAGPLPSAFTLDLVPDFERFFLVTSAASFELAPLEAALAELDGDAQRVPILPSGLTAHSTLLRKVTP